MPQIPDLWSGGKDLAVPLSLPGCCNNYKWYMKACSTMPMVEFTIITWNDLLPSSSFTSFATPTAIITETSWQPPFQTELHAPGSPLAHYRTMTEILKLNWVKWSVQSCSVTWPWAPWRQELSCSLFPIKPPAPSPMPTHNTLSINICRINGQM